MLSLGAQGVVSIASHLVGPQIKQMLDAFALGDVKGAQSMHNHLFAMFKGLFITTNPVPVKQALSLIGIKVGGVRLPMCDANEGEINQLKQLMNNYGLL
jgi:4-hydroxy-tetrahydrodipicolinate synthase